MLKYLPLIAAIAVLSCSQPSATPEGAPSVVQSPPVPIPTFTNRHRPTAPPQPSVPDKRSQAEINVSACTAADRSWRCAAAKPKAFGAAGSTPIIPASWTVPNWFVDPQNTSGTASDSNNCTTSATACSHWSEIAVHRLGFLGGCAAPTLSQNTSVTYLSSNTDGTDPVQWCPNPINATVSIAGTAPASVAAVFTRSSAKNRAAGTNALLAGSFSAGAPAVGKLVQNTTALKSSRAWIYKSAGGANWTMTQPLVPGAVGTPVPQAEVDTWATNDTVNVLTPVAVDIVKFAPQANTTASQAYLYQLTIFDPGGANTNQLEISGNVAAIECASQRKIFFSNATVTQEQPVSNVLTLAAVASVTGGPYFLGGASTAGGVTVSNVAVFDSDFINGTGTILNEGSQIAIGLMALDAGFQLNSGGALMFPFFNGSAVIYGTGSNTIDLKATSRFSQLTGGTYTAAFTAPGLVTGIKLNGSAAGCSHSNANNPDVANCNITTTPAHLDAAQGIAGFGGTAYVPGGASVSNVQ